MNIFFIGLLTIIASFIGTLTGFGTSTIMIPSLSLLGLPFEQTLLLVGIIHWFGNIWKILFFKEGIQWRLIATFALPGIIATFIGARLMFFLHQSLLSQLLGIFLIAYVIVLMCAPSFHVKPNDKNALIGGALSGLSFGIFGMGGALRSAFLIAYELPKSVYLATTAIMSIIIDSTRLFTYFQEGMNLESQLVYGLLLFIPASLFGAYLAKKTIDKIPQKHFRFVIALFLMLVGIKLVVIPF